MTKLRWPLVNFCWWMRRTLWAIGMWFGYKGDALIFGQDFVNAKRAGR